MDDIYCVNKKTQHFMAKCCVFCFFITILIPDTLKNPYPGTNLY